MFTLGKCTDCYKL